MLKKAREKMNEMRAQALRNAFVCQDMPFQVLVCRTPQNVLLLTGYQPILGNTFCLVTLNAVKDIELRLAVPADEQDLVPAGIALEVRTFREETLHSSTTTVEAVREPLTELLRSAHVPEGAAFGYEGLSAPIATGYTQVGAPGPTTLELLHTLFLGGSAYDVTPLLDELAARKTEQERNAIRLCERVAHQGFLAARAALQRGVTEADIAAVTTASLLRAGYGEPGVRQVQPHVHVMAGPRAALAYKAFNFTSNQTISVGDTVLVQMEIGVNGYWAELTRTFFAGEISTMWCKAHEACVAAQDAALATIHAGVKARLADEAARKVMEQAGFGSAFKHSLGHGFGFQAINHSAAPMLHPISETILQSGMVHNMEPAVYLEGQGGLRLNDNVLVRESGNEVLSKALPRDLDWLVVNI